MQAASYVQGASRNSTRGDWLCVCDCGFGVKPHAKTSFLIKKAQGVPKAQKFHTRLRRKAQLKARP